ncbi:MAG: cytochrome C oxidase subunit IV family protein [Chloroflexi bacterium]|nr:cytochrome C oxidase subunit IV family protein [Chloroflexota bacterium]
MTLAEIRGTKEPKKREEAPAAAVHHAPGEQVHPGPLEYVQIGAALAIVTGMEVGIYYLDIVRWLLISVLLVLSTIKFSLVVLWFMHLKFDNRLFTWFFVGGLALATILFVVVLSSLRAGLV